MDENPTLSEAVFSAIAEWLGDSGMPTGFIAVVPTMDSDGSSSLRVLQPDNQPYHTSLGLIEFAGEYVRDDIRTAFLAEPFGETD